MIYDCAKAALLLLLLCCRLAVVDGVEDEIRSYDGRNNNQQHPDWGAIHTPRIRRFPTFTRHDYGNNNNIHEYDAIHNNNINNSNTRLPSARRIMEELFRKAPPKKDKTTNHLLLEFGHFIVQDLLGSAENTTESMAVPCDGTLTDYVFCPFTQQAYAINTTDSMPFYRQTHTLISTNTDAARTEHRATINGMTAYLDLSNLYGLSEETSYRMRAERGTFMLDPITQLPPEDDSLLSQGMKNGMNTSPGAFAFYVLFMRYHNHVAEELYEENALLHSDMIFERARRQTIAVYQNLVEEGYLPTLLGDKLDPYAGYIPTTNPSIDEFFSTVSFRYAHTNFGGLIRVLDANFVPTPEDPLLLRSVFKQDVPRLVRRMGGIEPFLRGLTVTPAKAMDASFVDDLNVWSEATTVLDVQRGRDVGIPPYNQVREDMGLPKMASLEELAPNDTIVLEALQTLYHNNVDLVDAYVGAILEPPASPLLDHMGPVLTLSIKNQFTRLRNGDRFWYKNIYNNESSSFPSLSELVQLLCSDMDLFPDDPFLLVSNANPSSVAAAQEGGCAAAANEISFLNGDFVVKWQIDQVESGDTENSHGIIDLTLTVMEEMQGNGYIGIGFGATVMKVADIWFCTVDFERLQGLPLPERCSEVAATAGSTNQDVISCCVAPGLHHDVPKCSKPGDNVHYTLDVVDWCLSEEQSSVTIRAITCSNSGNNSTINDDLSGCFELESTPDGKMDVIVAYNPLSSSRPHGYQRRTAAKIDLRAGLLTQAVPYTADMGLMATHGAYMLIGWVVLAPIAVFVVRYMKTKSWRLVAHIFIMAFVGALMLPLLVGVVASVGTTDKTEAHSLVGLILVGIFVLMAGTGRFRYVKWQGQKIGRKTDFVTRAIHRGGGVTFIALAWWNCYTGLVRISPGDGSMGYDISAFGFIKDYIYFPWIAFVLLVFVIAEIRKLRSGSAQRNGDGSLWDDDGAGLDTMTIQTFLDVTRLGNCLCIVDGRVLDITDFGSSHPGGPEMLRYVRGSDITEEFLGQRDVDGISHTHSQIALNFVKTMVVARIVTESDSKKPRNSSLPSIMKSKFNHLQSSLGNVPPRAALPFRRAKVIDVQYLAPHWLAQDQNKPTILLRLSMARDGVADKEDRVTKLPGCSFRFRGIDKKGVMFEREYTAVRIANQKKTNLSRRQQYMSLANIDETTGAGTAGGSWSSNRFLSRTGNMFDGETDEECYDFVISLIPGGQMSNFFLGLKTGQLLLAQGPKVSPPLVSLFSDPKWKTVVFLAAGSGIAPMLQVIDFYLETKHREEIPIMFLVWVVKSPYHSFEETLGLTHRVKASTGRLKLLTIFSSVGEDSSSNASSGNNIKRVGLTVNSMRTSVTSRTRWTRASQTEWNPRQDITRASLSKPSEGVLAGLFGRRKRAKVRDLIARAQSQTDNSASCAAPDESGQTNHVFDSDFWNRPVRSISRAVDRLFVDGLLSSAHDYGAKQVTKIPSFQFVTHAADREQYSVQDWDRLALALRHGVEVKSRTYHLRTYHNCFVGSEAVDLLCGLTHTSRPEALAIGQQLAGRSDFLEHVCDPESHPKLEDGYIFYRFISRSSAKDVLAAPGTPNSKSDSDIESSGTSVLDATVTTRTAAESDEEDEEGDTLGDLPIVFGGMLVAVSGSPHFESKLSSILASVRLPRKQRVTFGISTQHV